MAVFRLTGLVLVISLSAALASRLPPVFNRMRLDRYRPRINFIHTPLRLQDKNQYFAYYENYPLRKHFNNHNPAPFLPPKLTRETDPFGNLFDGNGMMYLSLPKNDGDRLINKLMTDIIIANADKNDRVYTNKKLIDDKRKLRSVNILRSADLALDDGGGVAPKSVFDFYDVVG